MPHIVLEYTENLEPVLDASTLLRKVHDALGATEGFELDRIKSRAVRLAQSLVGREESGAFVHATVVFSQGRTAQLREQVGRSFLAILTAETQAKKSKHQVLCSVEVRQFESAGYFTSQERTQDRACNPSDPVDRSF